MIVKAETKALSCFTSFFSSISKVAEKCFCFAIIISKILGKQIISDVTGEQRQRDKREKRIK